jgi:hypothetical protein
MQEDEVEVNDKTERKYLKKVKKALKEHNDADTSLARQKLTEMRLKKKRKMKDRMQRDGDDEDDGDGEQFVVTIGNPEED